MKKFSEVQETIVKKRKKQGYDLPFMQKNATFVTKHTFVLEPRWKFEVDVFEEGNKYFVVLDGDLFAKGTIENGDALSTWKKDSSIYHWFHLRNISYITNDETLYGFMTTVHKEEMGKSALPMLKDIIVNGSIHLFQQLRKQKAN